MESSRSSKRLRIIQSYVSQQTLDLPATFESLSDDPLTTILEFVGKKSYRSFGGVNKHCKEIYLSSGMTKETFLYGYAPLSIIQERFDTTSFSARIALGKGVVFYDRTDILAWAVQEQNKDLLSGICQIASNKGRIDLLDEMWNNVNDEGDKIDVFKFVDKYAAQGGQLYALKWFEAKELLSFKNRYCACEAARGGQLHIIQWLREERGFRLHGGLYNDAIHGGGHIHVMKWLREQACPWYENTFEYAAIKGNFDVLQWLHDEGCPWPEDNGVYEDEVKPEVIEWCRGNGYSDRILRDW